MAKLIHEHVTVLDPDFIGNEMLEVQTVIRKLGEEHPEWKGMRWSTTLIVDTDRQSEFRVRIIDPNNFNKTPILWAVICVVVFVMLYNM